MKIPNIGPGLQSIAQGLQNVSGVMGQQSYMAQQRRQQADELRYSSTAQKHKIYYDSLTHNMMIDINKQWADDGFDRNSAAENFLNELDTHWNDHKELWFDDEKHIARFENDVILPMQAQIQSQLQAAAADYDIGAAVKIYNNNINTLISSLDRGANPVLVWEGIQSALDNLHGAQAISSHDREKFIQDFAREVNIGTAQYQIARISNSGRYSEADVLKLVDAITHPEKLNADSEDPWMQEAVRIHDSLVKQDDLDVFAFHEKESLKSSAKSYFNVRRNEQDREVTQQAEEFATAYNELTPDDITYNGIHAMLKEFPALYENRYSPEVMEFVNQYEEKAKHHEDNESAKRASRYWTEAFKRQSEIMITSQIDPAAQQFERFYDTDFQIGYGERVTKEEIENYDWSMFHDQGDAERIKNMLIDRVDYEQDYELSNAILEYYTDAMDQGYLLTKDDVDAERLLHEIKDETLRRRTKDILMSGVAASKIELERRLDQREAQTAEATNSIMRSIMSGHFDKQRTNKMIEELYLTGQITEDQRTSLRTTLNYIGENPMHKQAMEMISAAAIRIHAPEDPKDMTPLEKARISQLETYLRQNYWNTIEATNPERINEQFIQDQINSFANLTHADLEQYYADELKRNDNFNFGQKDLADLGGNIITSGTGFNNFMAMSPKMAGLFSAGVDQGMKEMLDVIDPNLHKNASVVYTDDSGPVYVFENAQNYEIFRNFIGIEEGTEDEYDALIRMKPIQDEKGKWMLAPQLWANFTLRDDEGNIVLGEDGEPIADAGWIDIRAEEYQYGEPGFWTKAGEEIKAGTKRITDFILPTYEAVVNPGLGFRSPQPAATTRPQAERDLENRWNLNTEQVASIEAQLPRRILAEGEVQLWSDQLGMHPDAIRAINRLGSLPNTPTALSGNAMLHQPLPTTGHAGNRDESGPATGVDAVTGSAPANLKFPDTASAMREINNLGFKYDTREFDNVIRAVSLYVDREGDKYPTEEDFSGFYTQKIIDAFYAYLMNVRQGI